MASGDHRFLTDRGWAYVAARGPRPDLSLAVGSRLMGARAAPAAMALDLARAPALAGGGVGVATPVIAARATCDAPRARVVARVASIEPLRAPMRLYDITTGTGDFVANGVVSHNCFARPTHTYLDMDAGRDFEREIVVKVNAPEVLRTELARPSWKGEHIAMGTNTDPYQWVEGRYKLMRGIWEALRDAANPCSVLTKSPLLLRDLDLMREIAAVTDIAANLSIPTMDEKPWRASEPHTPSPKARMEAVAELNRAGIPTGILVAPLMPGINDDPRQVERILAAAGEAGAIGVSGIALHLRGPGARDLHGVAAVLPARPRRALRGALPAGRVRAARGAGPAAAAAAHDAHGDRPRSAAALACRLARRPRARPGAGSVAAARGGAVARVASERRRQPRARRRPAGGAVLIPVRRRV